MPLLRLRRGLRRHLPGTGSGVRVRVHGVRGPPTSGKAAEPDAPRARVAAAHVHTTVADSLAVPDGEGRLSPGKASLHSRVMQAACGSFQVQPQSLPRAPRSRSHVGAVLHYGIYRAWEKTKWSNVTGKRYGRKK